MDISFQRKLSLFHFDLLLLLRRVGSGGIYVSMYFEVWYTFLKVLGVFLVMIVGSTLVFYVLLKEEVSLIDLFADTAAILNISISSKTYLGCPGDKTHCFDIKLEGKIEKII